jgi:hypothetical protein
MKLMRARHLFSNNSLTKFHENLTHGLAADNGLEPDKRKGWCHLCIRLGLHRTRSLTALHSDDVGGNRTSRIINKQFETCLSGYSSYDLLVRHLVTLQTYSDEIKSSFRRTVVCSCTPTFARVQRCW